MIETIDSPYIHVANSENFHSLVLENSNQGPVLVNFWSKKAGPCLRQYPILDKVIWHYDGRVLLVNIDTETEFIVTKEYGITSVPTIKLFRNTKAAETRHGYQSEHDLMLLLEKYVARDSDRCIPQAMKFYAENKRENAYETLTDAIVKDPDSPRLPLVLCKFLKQEKRYNEAMTILQSLPDTIRKNPEITQLYDLLWFFCDIDTRQDVHTFVSRVENNTNDLEARQQIVNHSVFYQQFEQALEELVNIIDNNKGYNNNYAQKAMLKLFNIIGEKSPLVSKYRPYLKRYTH